MTHIILVPLSCIVSNKYTFTHFLHQGPAELPKEWKEGPDGPEEIKLNKRQILKEYWARWGKWLKYQPLDHIRFVILQLNHVFCLICISREGVLENFVSDVLL